MLRAALLFPKWKITTTSQPSGGGEGGGEGKEEQPLGSRGRRVPVAHKQGADRSGSGDSEPPRIFAYFLFVKKVWPAAASGRVKTRAIPHRKVGAILAEEI